MVVGCGELIDQLAVEFLEEGRLKNIFCVLPLSRKAPATGAAIGTPGNQSIVQHLTPRRFPFRTTLEQKELRRLEWCFRHR
jgi:hypothetical protein